MCASNIEYPTNDRDHGWSVDDRWNFRRTNFTWAVGNELNDTGIVAFSKVKRYSLGNCRSVLTKVELSLDKKILACGVKQWEKNSIIVDDGIVHDTSIALARIDPSRALFRISLIGATPFSLDIARKKYFDDVIDTLKVSG